jgi:hypothetical protein
MCASWTIAADSDHDQVVVDMRNACAIVVAQGDARIVVSPKQLDDLSEKLYFLNEIFRASVEDALESLL